MKMFSGTGVKITILKRQGIKYDPGVFLRFYKICRRFKPDIIHTWGKMATFYSIPAKLLCRTPLVSSLISDTIRGYRRFSRYAFLLKTNMFFSDIVLSNSKAGLDTYNVNSTKSRVIYNGVRLTRFTGEFNKTEVRKELGIITEFMIIMVATFSEFKDYDLLVDTAKKTSENRNDVTFVAVGDGPELNRISKRIKNEGIENIILAGRHKHVERLIAASDIGLLCTKSEGISNSIIEYMALGKPVIASDLKGGSKELIIDGVTGYCTERNPSIISNLIEKLLGDADFRHTMGASGRSRIEKCFSINRMGEEFILLYNELSAPGIPLPANRKIKKTISSLFP